MQLVAAGVKTVKERPSESERQWELLAIEWEERGVRRSRQDR